jgi:uncharacterized membrane protein
MASACSSSLPVRSSPQRVSWFDRAHNTGNYYSSYRQDIGRAILLGLEFLIAGDIIRTVVVAPTIQNVLVLGLIVLIRTFLSLSLQLEIEGRLPWQREELPPH